MLNDWPAERCCRRERTTLTRCETTLRARLTNGIVRLQRHDAHGASKRSYRGLGIRIGGLQKVRDFNLSDPAVRAKMRERYGSKLPLNEPVISPVSMFRSELLVTVAKR